MPKTDFALDNLETQLLDEIERGEWIDTPLTNADKQSYAQNAAYTKALNEKRQTTIRFAVSDLAIIKSQAKEMGIGYQNLIQALVHNYATGKIGLGA